MLMTRQSGPSPSFKCGRSVSNTLCKANHGYNRERNRKKNKRTRDGKLYSNLQGCELLTTCVSSGVRRGRRRQPPLLSPVTSPGRPLPAHSLLLPRRSRPAVGQTRPPPLRRHADLRPSCAAPASGVSGASPGRPVPRWRRREGWRPVMMTTTVQQMVLYKEIAGGRPPDGGCTDGGCTEDRWQQKRRRGATPRGGSEMAAWNSVTGLFVCLFVCLCVWFFESRSALTAG